MMEIVAIRATTVQDLSPQSPRDLTNPHSPTGPAILLVRIIPGSPHSPHVLTILSGPVALCNPQGLHIPIPYAPE